METEECFYCSQNIPADEYAQHEEDCEAEHVNQNIENVDHVDTFHPEKPSEDVSMKRTIRTKYPSAKLNSLVESDMPIRTNSIRTNSKGQPWTKGRQKAQQLYCRFCDVPIYAKMNLIKHESLCEIIGKYRNGNQCLICDKDFAQQPKIHFRQKHLNIFDMKDQKSLLERATGTCRHCHLSFKSGMKAHEATCGEFTGILLGTTCLLCNKTFKKRSDAIRHARKPKDCRRSSPSKDKPRNENGTFKSVDPEKPQFEESLMETELHDDHDDSIVIEDTFAIQMKDFQ